MSGNLTPQPAVLHLEHPTKNTPLSDWPLLSIPIRSYFNKLNQNQNQKICGASQHIPMEHLSSFSSLLQVNHLSFLSISSPFDSRCKFKWWRIGTRVFKAEKSGLYRIKKPQFAMRLCYYNFFQVCSEWLLVAKGFVLRHPLSTRMLIRSLCITKWPIPLFLLLICKVS